MNEIVRARSTYFSIRDTSKGEGGGAVIGQSISSTAHSLSVFIYIYIYIVMSRQSECVDIYMQSFPSFFSPFSYIANYFSPFSLATSLLVVEWSRENSSTFSLNGREGGAAMATRRRVRRTSHNKHLYIYICINI